jgi:hypothetical protein
MFGGTQVVASVLERGMFGIGTRNVDESVFDSYDDFAPQHIPAPGPFLEPCTVLEGDDHAAFHRLARSVFEERGVYDVTFGYNLARLNLDRRHESAGFRYGLERPDAERDPETQPFEFERHEEQEVDDEEQRFYDEEPVSGLRVLRAEFTPTTEFCPQSEQLTKGAFRAWNGSTERHEYDLVKVRVHPMHQRSVEINAGLEALELAFLEDGSLTLPQETAPGGHSQDEDLSDGPFDSTDDVPF